MSAGYGFHVCPAFAHTNDCIQCMQNRMGVFNDCIIARKINIGKKGDKEKKRKKKEKERKRKRKEEKERKINKGRERKEER